MKPQLKESVVRDPEYLKWVGTLPCAVCGQHPTDMETGKSLTHAHHHPAAGHSSVAQKTDDTRALPLCSRCHRRVHDIGKQSFWGDLEAVESLIARLNIRYFFSA